MLHFKPNKPKKLNTLDNLKLMDKVKDRFKNEDIYITLLQQINYKQSGETLEIYFPIELQEKHLAESTKLINFLYVFFNKHQIQMNVIFQSPGESQANMIQSPATTSFSRFQP